MVAEAMLTPGAPNVPAKNLQTIREEMSWEKPAPRVNRAKGGKVSQRSYAKGTNSVDYDSRYPS
ncbi:MAG: hypothetical protein Q9157_008573 [Trypethelium eluteriae]